MVIAVALFAMLIGLNFWLTTSGARSSVGLTTRMGLQQSSRKALVRLMMEIQEGMEVLAPVPGSSLTYALVRDKLSLVRWFVQHPQKDGIYDLWRYTGDPEVPPAKRGELLLKGVKRLRFTSTSEGSLQINLTLTESGQEHSLVTTIRLRNLASAEALW